MAKNKLTDTNNTIFLLYTWLFFILFWIWEFWYQYCDNSMWICDNPERLDRIEFLCRIIYPIIASAIIYAIVRYLNEKDRPFKKRTILKEILFWTLFAW